MKQVAITTLVVFLQMGVAWPEQVSACSRADRDGWVFSNVHHVPEVDDYVGTEIVLNVRSGVAEVTGSWNEYEGYNPVTTKLSGRRSGKALQLGGVNSEGKVEFIGHLEGQRLVGKLIWYIGSSRQEKEINLVRKRRPVRPPK